MNIRKAVRVSAMVIAVTVSGVQQAGAIAPEPWDIPLDAVCTESDTFLVSP